MVGKVLKDRYELIAQLGKGGMSVVYLARDKMLGSYWAVKAVRKHSDVDINAFKKEVELLSSLNHSDIPRIVDRIEEDNYYFVVMDFVDGVALSKRIKSEGPISEKDVVQYMILLCDILDYLHNAKDNPIIYRDIKPENLMLTPASRIKLIDFGIAKECVRGQKDKGPKVGTKGYAAPEQYAGGPLDERTDIYSMGVTIFSLVTGKAPSKPVKKGQIIRVPLIRDVDPSLSEGLEFIVEKCTQIDPDERYQNCQELRYDLENIEKLNSSYKKSMMSKLMTFGLGVLIFLISLVSIGYGRYGMEKEINQNYQAAYSEAYRLQREENYTESMRYYRQAIENKEDEVDAYIGLFNVMILDSKEDEVTAIKEAVTQMRNLYLDEGKPMHKNAQLLYAVAKKCMEIPEEPSYYAYAADSFNYIKNNTVEYRNNVFNQDEIDSLAMLAESFSDSNNVDYTKMQEAMDALEENTSNAQQSSISDRLSNYYTLIFLYNTKADKLENSYARANHLGDLANQLVRDNVTNEEELDAVSETVTKIYSLLVKNQMTATKTADDEQEIRDLYTNALDWFYELELWNANLDISMQLRKAESYKGYFSTYKTATSGYEPDETAKDYMHKSISLYEDVLNSGSSDDANKFTASANLASLYCSRELIEGTNNISLAYSMLDRAKGYMDNLGVSMLRQNLYESVKQELDFANKNVSS